MNILKTHFIIVVIFAIFSCGEISEGKVSKPTLEEEKAAILATLNNETRSAFQRDYEGWTNYWVQRDDISKTYLNFSDSSFSESIGWERISRFVKTFIAEHPEPEPVPESLNDVDVRLYGDGAWVSYEQMDSIRGRKRETRLMEKIDGEWKIAGMQTTIYGDRKTD